MPHVSSIGGGQAQARGRTWVSNSAIVLAAAAVHTTESVQVIGLPNCMWWFYQLVGATGASVQLQFAGAIAQGPVVDWQPLIAPITLTLLTPSLTTYVLPVRWIRAVITAPVGNGVTFDYHIGGVA